MIFNSEKRCFVMAHLSPSDWPSFCMSSNLTLSHLGQTSQCLRPVVSGERSSARYSARTRRVQVSRGRLVVEAAFMERQVTDMTTTGHQHTAAQLLMSLLGGLSSADDHHRADEKRRGERAEAKEPAKEQCHRVASQSAHPARALCG